MKTKEMERGMSEALKIKEVLYGERYGDDSGWKWAVALRWSERGRRVVVEGYGGDIEIDVADSSIRAIAAAFNQIAEILGEDRVPDKVTGK